MNNISFSRPTLRDKTLQRKAEQDNQRKYSVGGRVNRENLTIKDGLTTK